VKPTVKASVSGGLGDDIGRAGSLVMALECVKGGGSMKVEAWVGTIGSGNAGISPAPEEVSIVMWLVGFGACRRV
jgi:hypothetical protein